MNKILLRESNVSDENPPNVIRRFFISLGKNFGGLEIFRKVWLMLSLNLVWMMKSKIFWLI